MMLALSLLTSGLLQAAPEKAQIATALQQQLEALAAAPATPVAGDMLHSLSQVAAFYEHRDYRPAWNDGQRPSPQAESLAVAIAAADQQGLDPADYHLAAIRSLLERRAGAPETIVQRELLLTDAFITYARHLAIGKLQPQRLFPEWNLQPEAIDTVGLLERSLADDHVTANLAALPPTISDYRGLRQALARYRKLARQGGWPLVPAGQQLQLGERSLRVALLRKRLEESGDLPADEIKPFVSDIFDPGLEQAVRHFQRRHGIRVDGLVGKRTLAELNVPVSTRILQIIINMERLRWLPRQLGSRYIRVNIPAFSLTAVADGMPQLHMRAIVGKSMPDNTTPVFTAQLSDVVLNPVWDIPDRIVTQELLPRLRQDPGLIASLHLLVLRGHGDDLQTVDPASIDWARVDAQNFPYRLRQEPGPGNSLGLIKFVSSNKYSVYLHDTPDKGMFDSSVRDLSHGCVRVEHPLQLALFALHDDPVWDEAHLAQIIASGQPKVIHLPEPLPLYFLYMTAWAGDGDVNFRNDIYQRDKRLLAALR